VQKQHNRAHPDRPFCSAETPSAARYQHLPYRRRRVWDSGIRAARPRRRSTNHAGRPPPPPRPSAPRRRIDQETHAMLRNFPQARRLLRSAPSPPPVPRRRAHPLSLALALALAVAYGLRFSDCEWLAVVGAGGWGSRRRTPTSGSRWARPRSAPTRSSASHGSGTRRRRSGGGRSSRAPRFLLHFLLCPVFSCSFVRSFVGLCCNVIAWKFPILLEVD